MAFGIELGAFWKNQDKNGNAYLSGIVKIKMDDLKKLVNKEGLEVKVFIGKNYQKAAENHPDYRAHQILPKVEEGESTDLG